MSVAFKNYKKSYTLEAFIKSLILGLSLGALLVGALLIVFKLCAIDFKLLYYIVVGVGVTVETTAVAFILLNPSEKKVAKNLDYELVGNEKVQTMVAFKDEEGDMVELQRKKTKEILENSPPLDFLLTRFLKQLIVFIVSVAVLLVGVLIPAKVKTPPPSDDDYAVTQWQIDALKELIEDVKGSSMQETPKAGTVAELEGLLEKLPTITIRAVMVDEVTTVMKNIDTLVEEVSTYKPLSLALNDSLHDDLKAIALPLSKLNTVGISESLRTAKSKLSGATLSNAIDGLYKALDTALTNSKVSAEDGLYKEINALSTGLKTVFTKLSYMTDAQIQPELTTLFDGAILKIADEVEKQKSNAETRTFVIEKLAEIFAIEKKELPTLSAELDITSSSSSSSDEEGSSASGGLGDGNTLFAGNDQIYHDGAYVEYGAPLEEGSVLTYYHNIVLEQIREGEDIPPELEKFINDYFASLSDGTKKQDEE